MTHDEVRDALPLFVVDADDRAGATRAAGPPRRLRGVPRARCRSTSRPPTRWHRACRRSGRGPSCVRARWPPSSGSASAAGRRRAPSAGRYRPRRHRGRPVAAGRRGWPPPRRWWPRWRRRACCRRAAEVADLRATLALWQARVADAERAGGRERNAQASQATLVTYRRQLDVMTADDLLLVSLAGVPPASAAHRPRRSSADRRTPSSSRPAICRPCRRRGSISCGPSPVARRSARARSCPTREGAASSSRTCRRSRRGPMRWP